MTTHRDEDETPSSGSGPTIGEEVADTARGVARELGSMVLRLAAGALLTLVGAVLAVAGLVTGSDLLRYAGVAILVVGVIWVVVVWNSHGVPGT